MSLHRKLVALLTLCLLFTAQDGFTIGLGDLKKKAQKEAEKKVPTETTPEVKTPEASGTETAEPEEAGAQQTAKSGSSDSTAAGDDFQLYTKFDFVPGQTVLFYDDLSGEEMAEFPSRWKLTSGVFEVAKVGKDPWIMASARGEFSPKLNINQLPERYTVEFEWLNRTSVYTGAFSVQFNWLGADGYPVAQLQLFTNTKGIFTMKDDAGNMQNVSEKPLPPGFDKGIHAIRIMVTKGSVKCYADNERLVNAPRTAGFLPTGFSIQIQGDDEDFAKEKIFLRNFRLAQGGKTMREQLDESGHIVTHGIYFDVNSDQIKGESYKTLADILQMMGDDPSLKLVIGGHTDSDGADAANLDLSQRRAESVKRYLVEEGKVDAARLEAKGFGETQPIDANTTPEGKANNRRVELAKS